ncbi:hypothetical protein D3C78_819750 [compost metagenome]
MILVFTFPCRKQSRNVRHLVIIHPHAAHRIMNRREDFHWNFTRIITHKLLVNFDNSAELNIKLLRIFVRKIKVHHIFAIDPKLLVHADMENFTCRNVTRNQITVGRIFFLQEIPGFPVFIGPDSPAFSTSRFRHQPQLIVSRNGRRVNLDKFAVSIIYPLLIYRAGCCSCVDN